MQPKLYKRFSFIGVAAIIGFFLPWIKACDEVESGFSIFLMEIFRRFDLGSVSLFVGGLLFILVPAYAILTAHEASRDLVCRQTGAEASPGYIKATFSILAVLSIWNLIGMGFPMLGSAIEEIPRSRANSAALFLLFSLCLASLAMFVAFAVRWMKDVFPIGYSEVVLLASLLPILGWGISMGAYYGLWIYFSATILRLALAIYQERNKRPSRILQ